MVDASPPSNDRCANATTVPTAVFVDTIVTTGATTEAADPIPECGDGMNGKSVWYTVSVPRDGTLTVDTFDSDYDTVLSVYTGTCGSLTPLPDACNDDDPLDGAQSQVSFPALQNVTYYLMVSAYNDDGGNLTLHARFRNVILPTPTRTPFVSPTPTPTPAPVPANDGCTTPSVVGTLPFSTTLSTAGATTAISDPSQSCTFGGRNQNTNSVWYTFTAPSNGTVTASTAGSDYDTVLTAYSGTCDSLVEVECDDDVLFPSSVTSQVTFQVTGRTTYLFEPTHSFLNPVGGMLHFALTFTAATPTAAATRTGALATATPSATPTPPPTPALAGDANCDGRIAAADLSALARLIGAGSRAVCRRDDANGDGVLTSADVPAVIEAIFDH